MTFPKRAQKYVIISKLAHSLIRQNFPKIAKSEKISFLGGLMQHSKDAESVELSHQSSCHTNFGNTENFVQI